MLVIRAISTGKVERQNKKVRCTSHPREKVFAYAPTACSSDTTANLPISSQISWLPLPRSKPPWTFTDCPTTVSFLSHSVMNFESPS